MENTERDNDYNNAEIGGFVQQVYEAVESAVMADEPESKTAYYEEDNKDTRQSKDEDVVAVKKQDVDEMAHVEDLVGNPEETDEASALDTPRTQSKIQPTLFVNRLQDFVRHPHTLRVIKGLILLAIAVKAAQSLEVVEQYIAPYLQGMDWDAFSRRS